ncbi:MAG: ABC transporter permease subunit [Candidatus Latescibacteria bacterium]|jgi:ABC-type transport system involved in multi-copper enzyme maturation permease subunit|nr:ABC transporter permease subunit [Candidatus Latescibacterota bacterium]
MRIIIERELMDNIKSMQFIVLFIFSIGLFSMNGFIFVPRIKTQVAIYYDNSQKSKPSTFWANIHKKPSLLMFISEGGEKHFPDLYHLYPTGRFKDDSYKASKYNYKMIDNPEMDWVFIIKVIFSLYVILLGYNSVCGEKEQGTLRQILSNPINRIKLLTAKYCSIIIIAFIPLLIGMIISLLIVGFSIPDVFSKSTLTSLLMIVITAFFYMSFFAFLSLFISSIVKYSSVSLIILLVAWLTFLIIPEMSYIISEKITNVPGEYQVTRSINSIRNDNSALTELTKRIEAGELDTEDKVIEEGSIMLAEISKKLGNQYKMYENSLRQRKKNARLISSISPMALLQFVFEATAGTGSKNLDNFLSDISSYSILYSRFVMEKVGKLVEEPIFSMGWHVIFKDKGLRISTPKPEQYEGDMSDFPAFQQSKQSFIRTLRDAMLNLSGLLLWNIVLAIGAFWAFLRADVR